MKRINNTLLVVIAAAAVGAMGVTAHATDAVPTPAPAPAPFIPSPASTGIPPSELSPAAKKMADWLDSRPDLKTRGYEYWVWTWREYFVVRWPAISDADRALVVTKAQEFGLRKLNILDPTRP